MPIFIYKSEKIFYETYGSGPLLILHHGFGSNKSSWIKYNWINSYYRFNAIKIMIMQILMPIVSFYVVSVIGYMIVNYFNFNEKNFGMIGISGLGLIPCLIAKSIYDFLTRPRPPALALIARNRRIFFNRRLRGAYYHPNVFINNMHPIAEHIIARNRHSNT